MYRPNLHQICPKYGLIAHSSSYSCQIPSTVGSWSQHDSKYSLFKTWSPTVPSRAKNTKCVEHELDIQCTVQICPGIGILGAATTSGTHTCDGNLFHIVIIICLAFFCKRLLASLQFYALSHVLPPTK